MNSKAIKTLIKILQSVTAAVLVYFCVKGTINTDNTEYRIKFIGCILRCICISVFSIFYYHSLTRTFGVDTPFMPLHLLFSIIAEIRILDTYSSVFFVYYTFPEQNVDIFIFAALMTVIPLIGYCLYYGNTDTDSITRFSVSSIVFSVLITGLIPKSQNLSDLWNYKAFSVLIYLTYIIAVFVCLLTILTDTPGLTLIRHFVALILVLSNYINLFYDTFVMNTVGTLFLICATFIIMLLTKRNSIRL